MSVGSVNSNVTFGQNQVKKNNSKHTAAYIAAGLGTAAAITGAVVYRKNIANTFKILKDKFTPSTTNLVNSMDDVMKNGKEKVNDIVDTVKGKVDEGVDFVQEKAGKIKETVQNKIDEGKEALDDAMNSETAQNIKDGTQGFFKNAGEFLKNAATKTWGTIKEGYNWVKEKVVGLYQKIKTFLSDLKKEASTQADAAQQAAKDVK